MPDSLLVTSEIDPSSVFNDVDGIPFSDWLEIEPALKYRQLTARELWNKVVQLSRIKDPFDFSDAKLTEECRWEKSPERVRRWRKCWIANGLLHEVEARPGGGVYSIVDRDPAALLKAVASIQGREFTPMEAAADFLVLQSQAGGPFLAPCEFLAARRKWAVPRVVPFLKFLMDRRAMWRIESVYQMVPRRLGGKMAGHTLPMAEKVGLKYRMRPSALAWFTKWEIDPSLGWFFGLPISGIKLVSHPLLQGQDLGPNWLTGGSYGIEGGIACTIALILITIFLWRTSLISATPELLQMTSEENPSTPEPVLTIRPADEHA